MNKKLNSKMFALATLLIIFSSYSCAAVAEEKNNSSQNLCLSPPQKFDSCQKMVEKAINNAKKSIWFDGGLYFSHHFINNLITASKRGVEIIQVSQMPSVDTRYIKRKDFFASGQLSLENLSSFTPNSNIVIIDDKQILLTAFSELSALQKVKPAHVLEISNNDLAQKYQKAWKPYKRILTKKQLASIKAIGFKQLVIPRNPNGNYFIFGKLNGTEVRFLVDTGASYSVVPKFVASHLGLKEGRAVVVNTAAGRRTLYRSKIDEVKVGEVKLKDLPVLINPYASSGTILLGMNFLRHLDFFIYKGNLYLVQRQISR